MPQADFEIQSLLLDPASNEGEAAQILACGETPVKLEKEILKSPAKAYHSPSLGRRGRDAAGASPPLAEVLEPKEKSSQSSTANFASACART